jgi:hypothetical protein
VLGREILDGEPAVVSALAKRPEQVTQIDDASSTGAQSAARPPIEDLVPTRCAPSRFGLDEATRDSRGATSKDATSGLTEPALRRFGRHSGNETGRRLRSANPRQNARQEFCGRPAVALVRSGRESRNVPFPLSYRTKGQSCSIA